MALKALNNRALLSLEDLACLTRAPKATLLRVLDTFQRFNLIERKQKLYKSTVLLQPLNSENSFQQVIRSTLFNLCLQTGCTCEWYIYNDNKLIISDREEPENSEISIKAKIGFIRRTDRELEAVVRIACAAGLFRISPQIHYEIIKEGRRIPVAPACAKRQIKKIKNLATYDRSFNNNGIRRYAAAVKKNHVFSGILAIAEHYTPDADQFSSQKFDLLQKAVSQMQQLI
ncbi:MAG TPA: hypothetical protein DC049_17875 [Spirochaetia bacterium]|nr:hypothetical protein [Spirochaetia bacterium]